MLKVTALLALLRPSSALQKPGAAGGWGHAPAAAPASPETPPFLDPEIAKKLDGVW